MITKRTPIWRRKSKADDGLWRVGGKVPLNVYHGDRAVCQCHNPEDALAFVEAMNDQGRVQAMGVHIKVLWERCEAMRGLLDKLSARLAESGIKVE